MSATTGFRTAFHARWLGNPPLLAGTVLLAAMAAFSLLGRLFWDVELARPLSVPVAEPPSLDHPFGTDASGRDMLAVMIAGTLLTIKVGLIAGALGVALGTALAFIAAWFGGWADRIVCFAVDVLLTVPGLLVLIVLASSIPGQLTTTTMALVIAALAWREPARQIRAQVLVMRQSLYVRMARLAGAGNWEIIFAEIMPNLLPYLGACLVGAVAGAVLASVGLEALGLGAREESTLGMTIYWMMREGAFVRGLWWWIVAPVVALILLFVGLYLLSVGLDTFANPRLRIRQ
jgi:peptide/nickel transport system permease protein